MPYKITTLVEDHLMLVTTWGDLTTEEFSAYDREATQLLLRSSKPLVHGIYDYAHLEGFPSLKDLATLQAGKQQNVGWAVFTGVKNKIVRMLVSMAVQLFRQRIRFCDTNREALDFLAYVDETLPDLTTMDLDAISQSVIAGNFAPAPPLSEPA